MTAQYRLLRPHFINGGYRDQGTVVTEGVEVPLGWKPTLSVDPLTTDAVNAFYAAGPRGLGWESLNLYGQENFAFLINIKPVTSWVQVSPGVFQLTGLGAGKAPVHAP